MGVSALRMSSFPRSQPDGPEVIQQKVVAALAKQKDLQVAAIEAAERKRKREEDEALQASAEEEVITVSKRDLVFVLRASRRAIEAARKCGDFLEKGSQAFKAQEAIFFDAKRVVERMLQKE